jgi:hypothetical protein
MLSRFSSTHAWLRCRLVVLAVAGASVVGVSAQTVFYVSPAGSDANPGTRERPFQSISRAQQAVRAVRPRPVTETAVLLAGGPYALDQALVFTAADSGSQNVPVVYRALPGETPVLSGGRKITGWVRDGETARWKARVEDLNFRQLYVNGRRAIRARGGPLPDLEPHGDDRYSTTLAAMADWRNPQAI